MLLHQCFLKHAMPNKMLILIYMILQNIKKRTWSQFLDHFTVIVFFASIYHILTRFSDNSEDIQQFKSFEDSLYYSVVTHSTVGFGHTIAHSTLFKRITMAHICIVILLYLR